MIDSQSGIVAVLLHYVRALSPAAAVLSLLRPETDRPRRRRSPQPADLGTVSSFATGRAGR